MLLCDVLQSHHLIRCANENLERKRGLLQFKIYLWHLGRNGLTVPLYYRDSCERHFWQLQHLSKMSVMLNIILLNKQKSCQQRKKRESVSDLIQNLNPTYDTWAFMVSSLQSLSSSLCPSWHSHSHYWCGIVINHVIIMVSPATALLGFTESFLLTSPPQTTRVCQPLARMLCMSCGSRAPVFTVKSSYCT